MIVDSCVGEQESRPAALDYLESMGVDIADQVKLVVATHWHDDHIRGLARVVRAAPKARFVCSAAIQTTEFVTLAKATGKRSMMTSSGIDEFEEVLSELDGRGSRLDRGHMFALGERLLYRHTARRHPSAEVWSLTPSDIAWRAAITELASLLPQARRTKRRIAPIGPNHASVVLWIRVGHVRVLLGGDLQETPGRHWTAVISSPTRPTGRSAIYKIAHHGSDNADHPETWTRLLSGDPIGLLTPFVQGGVTLPAAIDVARMCARSREVFITAPPTRPAPRRRERAVDRTIKEVTRNFRRALGPMGHIRARAVTSSTSPSVAVELFAGARRLCP
jgi:metallo-beta-lactamase superfamily protein